MKTRILTACFTTLTCLAPAALAVDDQVLAGFERQLNHRTTLQSATLRRDLSTDPLYTLVNQRLQSSARRVSARANTSNQLVASFERSLNVLHQRSPRLTSDRVDRDHPYGIVNMTRCRGKAIGRCGKR